MRDDLPKDVLYPLHVFRFHIDFVKDPFQLDTVSGGTRIPTGEQSKSGKVLLCSGAFSECTGLEATMEPKVIKEGGRNYGVHQRVGRVTFGTVILKRGITTTRDLWKWFRLVTSENAYAFRLAAQITVKDIADTPVMMWTLDKVLPVKFKGADLNAKGTEVGIEELHLAHEGLHLESLVKPQAVGEQSQ